jgi:hypothetical protein
MTKQLKELKSAVSAVKGAKCTGQGDQGQPDAEGWIQEKSCQVTIDTGA